MTGPEHYVEAERLLALADRHAKGVTYEQKWTLTLTAAQVHATLAVAAATAVSTAGPDGHAWADVAATRLSARKPKPLTVRLGPWSLRPSGLPSPRQPGLLWHARALSAETTGLGRPHQPRLHATGRSQVNWVSPRSVDTSP